LLERRPHNLHLLEKPPVDASLLLVAVDPRSHGLRLVAALVLRCSDRAAALRNFYFLLGIMDNSGSLVAFAVQA